MAYFDGYRPAYAPNPGYQHGYPQQMYAQQRMDFLQSAQQPAPAQMMQQPGDLQARIVTSREEAVASQVLPDGRPCIFYNPNRQEVYLKRIDPQSGAAEFADFGRIQPQQMPQAQPVEYAPMTAISQLEERMDRIESMLTQPQPNRRQKGADAE